MKFSKVNNYKTAVTDRSGSNSFQSFSKKRKEKDSFGKTGILYRDPARAGEGAVVDIAGHVDRQTRAAQRLYSVVNPPKEKEICAAARIARTLDNAFDIVGMERGPLDAGKVYASLIASVENRGYSEANIDKAVDLYLRKSLYQTSARAVKNMLRAASEGRLWNDLPNDERAEYEAFMDCLYRDYRYEKVRKHVVKSIEHQNIVVQPNEDGIFAPSAIPLSTDRNRMEKEAMTGFLSEYANLDDAVRHDLRLRLRRLVILFFYGQDEVPVVDFDEWEDHAARRSRTEPFSEEAAAYLAAAREEDRRREARKDHSQNHSSQGSGKVRRDGKDRVKAVTLMLRQENMARYRRSVACAETSRELYLRDDASNRFWIHHIENSVERIYNSFRSLEDFRLSTGYLGEKVWKGMLVFLCGKYIATGKAVYHFAMDEGMEDPEKSLVLGKIRDEVKNGLTSFDYEQIKAEEVLQRDTAVYVAFAANHLSSATIDISILMGEKNKEDKEDIEDKEDGKYKKGKEDNKDKEDFLLLKKEDLQKAQKPHLRRNILQFFGGESAWRDFPFEEYYQEYAKSQGSIYDDVSLLDDLRKIIYALRNESFHFDTRRRDPGDWNRELVAAMFAHDCGTASRRQREKFYSNNLPMFYGEKELLLLLNALYGTQASRASQVPSFNRVVVRRNFSDYIREELGWKSITFSGEDGIVKKQQFDSALYYLLKEIYYNLFLQGKTRLGTYNTRREFVQWCNDPDNGRENEEAFKSFQGRVLEITAANKDISLPGICQQIMTDFNQQNNQTRKVKSDHVKKNLKDSYSHFRMLLYKGLREVFAAYINAHFDFLKSPSYREMPEAEAFLPDYESPAYAPLVEKMRGDADLQKWYVVGRLLNPRQANLFVGVLRQYVQYAGQILRRARETGSGFWKQRAATDSFEAYEGVLEVCIQLSGMTTNCLEDYFEDKDDYARHVGNYLEFEGEYPGISLSQQLERFCNENAEGVTAAAGTAGAAVGGKILINGKGSAAAGKASAQMSSSNIADIMESAEKRGTEDEKGSGSHSGADDTGYEELKRLGIFYDVENPILNRNILLSKIYGTESVLVNIARNRKVTREDIHSFYEQRKKLGEYRITGRCETAEQQRSLKKYQEIKNKVEFRDLVEFEEIIDELQGQMIDWCFLRERDLMYFQLGFHYTCLCNDSPKPELYRKIVCGNRTIDGAILYQVAAMYVGGLPIYTVEKGKIKLKNKSGAIPTGGKIGSFLNYAKACQQQLGRQDGSRQDSGQQVPSRQVPNQKHTVSKNGSSSIAPIEKSEREKELKKESEKLYYAGVELFENISEHDNIVALRNYIEHFHYYARQDRSLLDLYGEIFDRFFTYDMKYQKNVCNLLYNILMHHFVRVEFTFSTAKKEVGEKKETEIKDRAAISLREGRGISSEQMTYKLTPKQDKDSKENPSKNTEENKVNNDRTDHHYKDYHKDRRKKPAKKRDRDSGSKDAKPINLDAKSRDFLEGVATLLYYPDEPGNVVSDQNDQSETGLKKDSNETATTTTTGTAGEVSLLGQEKNKIARKFPDKNRSNREMKGRRDEVKGQDNGKINQRHESRDQERKRSDSFGTPLADLLKDIKL